MARRWNTKESPRWRSALVLLFLAGVYEATLFLFVCFSLCINAIVLLVTSARIRKVAATYPSSHY